MNDWMHAELHERDSLARLHHFSMIKYENGREIEFAIKVREYVTGADHSKRFVAKAYRQTNQKTAPYMPIGWGHTLGTALADCVRAVHRFAYEGDDL